MGSQRDELKMNSCVGEKRPTNLAASTSTGADKDRQGSQKPSGNLPKSLCVFSLILFFLPVVFEHMDVSGLQGMSLFVDVSRVLLIAGFVYEVIMHFVATVLAIVPVAIFSAKVSCVCIVSKKMIQTLTMVENSRRIGLKS
ncbi:amino acid APC transporter, putative [Babesia ovata]|uniref:Amino acid APC transporter, putative n=1 Tax=Babesia ovata TaxID=189622 RepID=A0A2H6KCC5_9APIC|nr:amino acid APC transporter, putative [Babesia ovata]GBE60609.1 amino acid APC transporter, putative [Babesia ovata]